MTIPLLTLALLAAPGARCSPAEAHALVSAAVPAAARYGLSARLLVAVALAESGARPGAVGPVRRGGRALGAWQLWAPHRPVLRRALAGVAGLAAGAEGAAWLLAESRRRCGRQRCPCPWARYNWRGRRRWCAMVRRALQSLQRRGGEA